VACGCADNTIRAFDAKDGKQLLFQGAHADWVVGTIFSQDGQHIASISRDRSMKLTEVPTNRFVDNITSITPGALKGGLLALDLRPLPDLTIKQVAQLVAGFAQPVNGRINPALLANSFTPAKHRLQSVPRDTPGVPPKPYDELLIAGADGQPRLYMMHRESKRVIGDDSNKVREYEALPGRVYAVAFNKKGTQFVAGSSLDGVGEARVYDVKSAKRLSTFEAVKTPVYTVAFHPQGDVVATGGFDGKVRLSEAATGKLIKEFDPVPLKK
jgi:WD40 repeat protein